MTQPVTTAARGRYIRRSAATSVTIGTKLEVGARMRKNHAPRNPSAGRAAQRPEGRGQQRRDDGRRRDDLPGARRDRPGVVEAQRARPEAQPQVVQDDARLRARVFPRPGLRQAEPGAGRRAPRIRDHQRAEDRPRRGQAQIQWPPAAKRLAERSGEEASVVQEHDDRRGRHDLFGAHAQGAGGDGRCVPSPGMPAGRAADRAVEREQKKQPHETFCALSQIGHRFGQQGMDRPDQRHGHREAGSCAAEPLSQ